ncbi:Hypothetical protein PBC10988_21360 [Planctomycetales bacterium 10988]|nr:Hypothetical protein PBC10988_21360 [Planctomycetales bacterium 10988]
MIIFGWRDRASTKERGNFYCPQCEAQNPFKRQEIRSWFTLYFIPVIPLHTKGEYVECNRCRGTFHVKVLSLNPEKQNEEFAAEYQHAMVAVMTAMLLADGNVDDSEIDRACEIYERVSGNQASRQDMLDYVNRTQQSGEDILPKVQQFATTLNEHGKEMIVKAAYMIAAADGTIDPSEQRFLGQLGGALGLSKAHFRGILSEVAATPLAG